MKPILPGRKPTDQLMVAGLRWVVCPNGAQLSGQSGMAPPYELLTWHDLGRIRDWIARQMD